MKKNYLLLLVSLISFVTSPLACTDFKLTAKDGTILITRSMEFGPDLKSNLRSSPRGRLFTATTPNNKSGLQWKSNYGYLYVDGFNLDASFDGVNEAGLAFEYLYLPGETQYQTVPAGKEAQAIPYIHFGDWVLGNFKTIDEVKQALPQIYVYEQTFPELGSMILPAHAAIHDASGKEIVVEFYNNKINVYDNIGVMTNSPKYDWHVTNLRNYLNLSAKNAKTIIHDGIAFTSTGQGSGAVGLPGDASPPSRFVKIAFMIDTVFPAQDAATLVNLAEHIINNVDLPAGFVQSEEKDNIVTDTTQWVVFKDLSHRILYFRTYNDMSLRKVMLDKIDFSKQTPVLKMPLYKTSEAIDITDLFLKSANKSP